MDSDRPTVIDIVDDLRKATVGKKDGDVIPALGAMLLFRYETCPDADKSIAAKLIENMFIAVSKSEFNRTGEEL